MTPDNISHDNPLSPTFLHFCVRFLAFFHFVTIQYEKSPTTPEQISKKAQLNAALGDQ